MKLFRFIFITFFFLSIGQSHANHTKILKSAFFNSKGFRLHYLEQGEGETVLLLHGFTMDAQSWVKNGVMPELAKNYHVLALDARAHGRSEKPRDKNAYGLETALDVIRLMDLLQIEKAHLVGSSFGVRLATTIMSRYPERFITATLIGGSPQWEWNEREQEKIEKSADKFKNNPFPSTIEKGLDPTALAYLRLSFSELIVESEEKFKALTTPFLLVNGSEEWMHYSGTDKKLKEMLINARIFVVDGAKHGETLLNSEFLLTLKDFLKEN